MTFDQIRAYHPHTGRLHTSAPEYPGLEETLRRQGFRIERIPAAEVWGRARALRADPADQATDSPLPAVGDWVTTPTLGLACVTHMLTLPGEYGTVAVASGPRGSGMVRAGQWQPAAEPSPPNTLHHSTPMTEPSSRSASSPAHSPTTQPSLFAPEVFQ